MTHQMFVIYDSKANAYMQPWFLTQQAMAQRAFMDCVNDKDHNFGRHPEDYTLFLIGTFDDQNANIKWQTPVALGNGIEYVKTEQQTDQQDLWPKDVEPKDYDETDRAMLAERKIQKCDGENQS